MTSPSRRVALLLALAGAMLLATLPVMPWAVHAQTEPAAPSNLAAQSAGARVLPERDAPTEGAGSVAGYEILRRPTDIRDPGDLPSIVGDTPSSPTGHSVALADDEPDVTVSFEKIFYQFAEAAAKTYVWVWAETAGDAPPMQDFTVTVVSNDDSAVAGKDFIAVSTAVAFNAADFVLEDGRYGQLALVPFHLIHDEIIEQTEYFNIQLESSGLPSHVSVSSRDSAKVEIRDKWGYGERVSPTALVSLTVPDHVDEGEAFDATVSVDKEIEFPWNAVLSILVNRATATDGADYESATLVLQFEASQRTKTVRHRTLEDNLVEGDEHFEFILVDNGTDDAIILPPYPHPDGVVTIRDDDAPSWRVTATPDRIAETGATTTTTVTVSAGGVAFPEAKTIALDFAGAAAKGTDYAVGSETLTLAAGQESVSTTIRAISDMEDERPETIRITARLGGATLGAPVTVALLDGGGNPPAVTRIPTTIAEGEDATVTIVPPNIPSATDQTLTLVTAGASDGNWATAGADYTVAVGGTVLTPQYRNLPERHLLVFPGPQPHYTLTVPTGELFVEATLTALDDPEPEPREYLSLLVFQDGQHINDQQTGPEKIFIRASDTWPEPQSASIRGATATVTFSRAVRRVDYQADEHDDNPLAEETAFLFFTGQNPTTFEGPHNLPTPAAGQPGGDYAESFSVSGNTLSVTFPEAAAADERAWVVYDKTHPDGPLDDASGSPHSRQVARFIIDAENLTTAQGGALPALSVADAGANEANGSIGFLVTLDGPASSAVTVDYATSDGAATAGDDYTAASGTLNFGVGDTRRTVTVTILDDTVEDGGETFKLTLSNPAGAYIDDGEATGTILNTEATAQDNPLTGFTLLDAATGTTIGSLTDGGQVELSNPANGSFGILAETADGSTIGSVRLELTGAKTSPAPRT